MTTGTIDLFESERGVFAIFLVLASVVLVIVGKITGEQWLAFVQVIAGVLITSKTITGGIIELAKKTPASSPASPEPTP